MIEGVISNTLISSGIIITSGKIDANIVIPNGTTIYSKSFTSICTINILGIESITLDEAKTKKFKAIMDALKLKGESLFVLDTIDDKVMRASGNLEEVSVKNYKDFNTMDVLNCDNLVISKAAIQKLPERFKD